MRQPELIADAEDTKLGVFALFHRLRQPFGGTKASGTGREVGTWSFEVFCEPKNVCVSITDHHIPKWGAT